jgi:radical SAM superfamily enzyme YgiQ (UPF0313 family)
MNEIVFWTGIWPTNCTRPIGVYQLSHWLRKHNIDCQIIDFCQWYSAEELVNLTSHFITAKTKYIGISTAFWINSVIPSNIIDACKLIKKEYPTIKLVFGGPRADSVNVREIADIVLLGEAEGSLLNLLKGHNINSLNFDITKLDHRFTAQDCIIDGEILPIELGRGCIFKCKFCAHHNIGKSKHTYQRNSDLIKEEIEYNFKNFKTTQYMFLDDTVNEDVDKIKTLSEIPGDTGISINWVGYLRVDLLWRYPETPHLLKQSGLKSCFFGIETFHKHASTSIGKGWSSTHGKEYLTKLYYEIWNGDINLWCNFIVGLPEETIEDLKSTRDWCLDNQIGHHQFTPLSLYASRTDNGPKSEFTKNYSNYGYRLDSGNQWISTTMNEEIAHKITNEFNNTLIKSNRLSCWFLADVINCGISIQDGQQELSSTLASKRKNFKKFLDTYKNKLLTI